MKILLGVSAGIAAYKIPDIVSSLVKRGHKVRIILTKDASKLVSKNALETMSQNKVIIDMWKEDMLEHIELTEWLDILLIAPATYNTIGKIACGIADNMLTTVTSATKKPIFIAPAMNGNMYNNPIFEQNLSKLKSLGYNIIEPDDGFLACGVDGKGRLAPKETIISTIENSVKKNGKTILITTGATVEPIDPVRFITNHSSGVMGLEIAKEAKNLGYNVILINCNEEKLSASELYKKVMENIENADVFISVAAVADYTVEHFAKNKIKKSNGNLTLELVRTKDILHEVSKVKKKNQILVGFAAETENLIENAKQKLEKKNLDLIIANDAKYMGSNKNKVYIISKNNNTKELPLLTKSEVAREIMTEVGELIQSIK